MDLNNMRIVVQVKSLKSGRHSLHYTIRLDYNVAPLAS
jgi:hypothetical protein